MGALHMVFGGIDQSPKPLKAAQTRRLEQEANKISEAAEAQDLASRVADDLEELKLTDPLAFERLLGGELAGDGSP